MLSSLAPALLTRCDFPPPGTPIDCAVSGGPDSLALLALAVAAGCRATAHHVDHGLRSSSAEEAEVVAVAAQALGARFVSLRADCLPGPNLEARARAARFAVLPPGVATGHTADDQAETILLNLLRGAGADGLRGMRPSRAHPLLRLRRHETEALVGSLGLTVVRDPSNASPRYRRNRVRHELLPLAEEVAGRDLVPVLTRQAGLLAEESDLLDQLASALDPEDARALAGAPLALARRAVRSWLRTRLAASHPPDAAATERVLAVARGEVLACELAGGVRISRSKGRLLLHPSPIALSGPPEGGVPPGLAERPAGAPG